VFAPRRNQVLIQTLGCLGLLLILVVTALARTSALQELLAPFVPGIAT
jgi:hypothetical protein